MAIEHAYGEDQLKRTLLVLVTTNKFSEVDMVKKTIVTLDPNAKTLANEVYLLRNLYRSAQSGSQSFENLFKDYKAIEASIIKMRDN